MEKSRNEHNDEFKVTFKDIVDITGLSPDSRLVRVALKGDKFLNLRPGTNKFYEVMIASCHPAIIDCMVYECVLDRFTAVIRISSDAHPSGADPRTVMTLIKGSEHMWLRPPDEITYELAPNGEQVFILERLELFGPCSSDTMSGFVVSQGDLGAAIILGWVEISHPDGRLSITDSGRTVISHSLHGAGATTVQHRDLP